MSTLQTILLWYLTGAFLGWCIGIGANTGEGSQPLRKFWGFLFSWLTVATTLFKLAEFIVEEEQTRGSVGWRRVQERERAKMKRDFGPTP